MKREDSRKDTEDSPHAPLIASAIQPFYHILSKRGKFPTQILWCPLDVCTYFVNAFSALPILKYGSDTADADTMLFWYLNNRTCASNRAKTFEMSKFSKAMLTSVILIAFYVGLQFFGLMHARKGDASVSFLARRKVHFIRANYSTTTTHNHYFVLYTKKCEVSHHQTHVLLESSIVAMPVRQFQQHQHQCWAQATIVVHPMLLLWGLTQTIWLHSTDQISNYRYFSAIGKMTRAHTPNFGVLKLHTAL